MSDSNSSTPASTATEGASNATDNGVAEARASTAATIAGIVERSRATATAQGKTPPMQGNTVVDRGGERVRLNGDGTTTYTAQGNIDTSLPAGMSASSSSRAAEGIVARMNEINAAVTGAVRYDELTGKPYSTMDSEVHAKMSLEFDQLAKSHAAQVQVTAQLQAREVEAQKVKDMVEYEERVIRQYAGGDKAREKAIRDALGKQEAEEAARAVFALRR